MKEADPCGKTNAGKPHVRFDESVSVSAKPRRGSLFYTSLSVCACVVWAQSALFAIEPVIEGSTYTFTVNEGEATYSAGLSGTGITLVKNGAGKLTLTGNGLYSFSGTIQIDAGTLATEPQCFLSNTGGTWGSLGKPSVSVADGACFDCSGTGSKDWGPTVFGALTIRGSGPDGNGALLRTPPTGEWLTDFLMFSTITLQGDTTFGLGGRFRLSPYTGQGYNLLIKGVTGASVYGYNMNFNAGSQAGGTKGTITLKATGGYLQLHGNYSFTGNSTNVITLDGSYLAVSEGSGSQTIPYTIIATNQSVFSQKISSAVTVTGPVTIYGGSRITMAKSATYDVKGAYSVTPGDKDFRAEGLGTVKFGGPFTINQSVDWLPYGYVTTNVVFYGADTKYVNAQIMGQAGGQLVFDGAIYARLGGQYQTGYNFYGGKASPALLWITNSTVDIRKGVNIGTWANGWGFLRIEAGATMTNAATMSVGGHNATEHLIYGRALQAGGTAVHPGTLNIGYGTTNHGYYAFQDGVFESSASVYVGREGGSGFFRMSGGQMKNTGGSVRVGEGPTYGGGYGVFHQSGGTAESRVFFGGADTKDGTAGLILLEGAATTNLNMAGNFMLEPTNAYTAVFAVNDGAYFRAQRFLKSASALASGKAHLTLSLDGGILAQTWSGMFTQIGSDPIASPDVTLVHEKGAVLAPAHNPSDDVQYADAYFNAFLAPTGQIVQAIALPTAGAFATDTYYMGPPRVTITGPGVGAAAVAEYDAATRTVTGIRVVASGTGYGAGTTATIESSGRTTAYACEVTLAAAPTTGAGLTVDAAPRTVSLDAANTYHGPTTVKSGTLRFGQASALPTGSGLIVKRGAYVNLVGRTFTVPTFEAAGIVTNGNLVVSQELTMPLSTNAAAHLTGTLTLTDGAKVTLVEGDEELDPERCYSLTLLTVDGGITYPATSVSIDGIPDKWRIRLAAKTIGLYYPRGTSLMIR